ncbi:MAG: 2-nitropropane dioxygenase [Candidatus Thorarchaeota archaeon SMTZ-45]|nr:MAG: 2-nitropropane dioxygenase [Candidatus Thorarchaeota archaeon SMTZ-45]
MIKTRVTEMLGCKYPIIAGTMARISNPEFVSAASNAGACAVLASANYKSPDELRDAIKKTKSLTNQPFAVNINLFPALMPQDKLEDYVDATLAEGVEIIETSGHKAPEALVPKFKDGGVIWIHKCAGVRYAIKGVSLGADIVTVVGYENGGATGILDIGTMVMTPSVVDALDVPVIAGGGISDGRGIAAVLALGAEGVIMGTRMMATKECPIHDNLKRAFVEAKETDTSLVLRSIQNTHRIWNNKAAQHVIELESQGAPLFQLIQAASGDKAEEMYREGDIDLGVVSCGQGVGLIKDIPTVKELLDTIMTEAEEVISRLSRMSK